MRIYSTYRWIKHLSWHRNPMRKSLSFHNRNPTDATTTQWSTFNYTWWDKLKPKTLSLKGLYHCLSAEPHTEPQSNQRTLYKQFTTNAKRKEDREAEVWHATNWQWDRVCFYYKGHSQEESREICRGQHSTAQMLTSGLMTTQYSPKRTFVFWRVSI